MIVIRTKANEVVSRLRDRFRDRVLEWEHAVMTLLWGMIVLANPGVFAGPSFVAFKGGPVIWGWGVTVAGVLRITALCVNGYMAKPTAVVRAFAAASGILLFGALSLGFLFAWTWGTGLAVYPVIGFFGLFSLYWAIFDVASPGHHDAPAP